MECWRDSFDYYTSGLARGYNAAMGHHADRARTGPQGTYVTSSGTSAVAMHLLPSVSMEHATLIQGIAIRRHDANALAGLVFLSDSGLTTHITVSVVIATGEIQVRRGTHTGTLLASSAAGLVLPNSNWHYLEALITLGDGLLGSWEVHLDGVQIIAPGNGDTKNGGTKTVFDAFGLRSNGSANLDDYYVNNAAGSINNTFNGDTEVLARFATSNGDVIQLTPSAGANWECVDDAIPSATDYVSGVTDGLKDLYHMGSIPNAGVIHAVTVQQAALKAAGTEVKYVRDAVKSGGTTVEGTSQVLTSSLAMMQPATYELDPATGAMWLPTAVNAVQVGPVVKDS